MLVAPDLHWYGLRAASIALADDIEAAHAFGELITNYRGGTVDVVRDGNTVPPYTHTRVAIYPNEPHPLAETLAWVRNHQGVAIIVHPEALTQSFTNISRFVQVRVLNNPTLSSTDPRSLDTILNGSNAIWAHTPRTKLLLLFRHRDDRDAPNRAREQMIGGSAK